MLKTMQAMNNTRKTKIPVKTSIKGIPAGTAIRRTSFFQYQDKILPYSLPYGSSRNPRLKHSSMTGKTLSVRSPAEERTGIPR
jgi:hypothetical protein